MSFYPFALTREIAKLRLIPRIDHAISLYIDDSWYA